jgi:acetyl esterase/lipase
MHSKTTPFFTPYYSFIFLLCVCFSPKNMALHHEVNTLLDVAYGEHPLQTMDVYVPHNAHDAPIIFMVHGGAWKTGDKAARAVVKHKVRRWVSKGFIFISINYRLLPDTAVISQYYDVMLALHTAQQRATSWGGSPSQLILMGHSAGAHLVTLLSSAQSQTPPHHLLPTHLLPNHLSHHLDLQWLGTIAIDSAVYDVVTFMHKPRVKKIYSQAFGKESRYWQLLSPYFLLHHNIPPFMAICSTQRNDDACTQATTFTDKARRYRSSTQVLAVDLSHRGTNIQLGKRNSYTQAVETFMRSLSPQVSDLLTPTVK